MSVEISPLFYDLGYYATNSPDLGAAGLTAPAQQLEHLKKFGVAENRKFSPLIDIEFYGAYYPDLQAAGFDREGLLEHLQTFGVRENRRLSAAVNLEFYRTSNADLSGLTYEQLFEHLQTFGIDEGRSFSDFFDLKFYRNSNADLAGFGNKDLLEHFLEFGISESRTFSISIDPDFYRNSYADLAGLSNKQLLQHYQQFGIEENRMGSALIDLQYYGSLYADLAGFSKKQLLDHLLEFGLAENRKFSRFVDLEIYRANNADLANFSNLELLQHLDAFGLVEGRKFSAEFDLQVYSASNPGLLASLGGNFELLFEYFIKNQNPIAPSPVNNPPAVAAAISDQTATAATAFSFQIPATTFTDADALDTLTFNATLENGSPLPAWLTFNAATGTFSGTATATDVGTLNVKVTATDSAGAFASDIFALTVGSATPSNNPPDSQPQLPDIQPPANNPPVVAAAISDQTATVAAAFSFQIPAGTFTDADGQVLALSATLENGSPLPAWLTFNAATRTFSGTAAAADVGTINVKVTAADSAGGTVSDTFAIAVGSGTPTNTPPEVGAAIVDQTATAAAAFTFTIPTGTFTDADAGDTLTFSATLEDGSDLPAWLTFDAATRTFSGTATADDVGAINVKVTATDSAGAFVSDTFAITVGSATPTNNPPEVGAAIVDQTATTEEAFSFTIGVGTFTDADAGDTLTLSATLDDGSALPEWLSFDATAGTFTGTAAAADVGTLNVKVTATDSAGAFVSDTFAIEVGSATPTNTPPEVGTAIVDQTATAEEEFTFTIPTGTFTDADAGDTLTLSATLDDGSPLPEWLSFDATAGTFQGTAAAADVGTLNVKVTATDSAGETASDTFALAIAGNPLPDQTATEDTPFSFQVPDTVFGPAGTANPPVFSATLATDSDTVPGNDPLPAWLTFDQATRTFRGTPRNDNVGELEIQLTATGGALSAPVSDSFKLTVENVNDAPALDAENPLPNKSAPVDAEFTFSIPETGSFIEVDADDTLTYSATAGDGSPLPDWLSFDSLEGTFTGTPTADDAGTLDITVTATDSGGETASDTFTLAVGVTGVVEALFDSYEEALTTLVTDPVQDFLAEDVTWNIAGDSERIPFAGQYSYDEIASYFTRQVQSVMLFDPTPMNDEETGFKVLDIIEGDPDAAGNTRVAVRVSQQGLGAQTGDFFETDFTFLLTVSPDGLVSSLDGYYNTYPVAAVIADQPAPAVPDDDPLTGEQAANLDPNASESAALAAATGTWNALIAGDLATASTLEAPDATWSFAVGGPSFLPYVGAAQGFTADGATLAPDFSNAGPVIGELLGQLGRVVRAGDITIEETFVEGNRVLVRLRETGATAIETGNQYDLDLLSWFTVSADGLVESNQVIVDTYQTANALRPGDLFPLSPDPAKTRHEPPYFVAGSLANSLLLTYDEQGKATGILGEANNYDTDEFQGPIALTYGPDGDVYVTAGINRTNNNIINAVFKFDGISGEFIGNGDNGFTGDRAGGVTDAFGDAFAFLDPTTRQPIPKPGTDNLGSIVNALTGKPFDPAVDSPSVAVPGLLIPTGIKFGPSSDPNDGDKENLYVASGFTSRILEYDGETGDFLGTFGLRPNGAPGNFMVPTADNTQPDFSVLVFGPDGNIYICSLGSDADGNESNGAGAVLSFVGPDRVGPNGEAPGTLLGVFGDATNAFEYTSASGQPSRLNEPSALAFGPDLNLYVNSAQTGEVLQYAGPLSETPGKFLGVYADLNDTANGPAVPTGGVADSLLLSSIGFGPEGTLYVGNSFNNEEGIPIAGSEFSAYSGPLSANPGQYLGAFGQATTGASRLLFPLTPEFVFTKNSYANPNDTPTERYGKVAFVVAANTDGPAAADGTPGTLINDGTDALVAFDEAGNRLYDIGGELFGADSPLQGIGGIVLSPDGNILVASQLTDQVLEFDGLTGAFIGVFGKASPEGSGLNFPADVALGPNNDLYVADLENERVLRFNGYSGDFVGVAVDASEETPGVVERLTSLAFGPDGRLYVGYNPPQTDDPSTPEVEPAQLGAAEIRAYNPDTGELEGSIAGLDFVSDLSFGPDGRLYVSDTPAEIRDPLTGQPVPDPATGEPRQNSIKVYNIPNIHPLLVETDPATGDPVLTNGQQTADPQGVRIFEQTPVAQLSLNPGEGGGIQVGPDGRILSSNAGLGSVSFYTFNSANNTIAAAGSPIEVPLPSGALPQNGGLDSDQLSRPTGAIFMQELTY